MDIPYQIFTFLNTVWYKTPVCAMKAENIWCNAWLWLTDNKGWHYLLCIGNLLDVENNKTSFDFL
jgi:hypothetical protein